jgi:hypothetical protein
MTKESDIEKYLVKRVKDVGGQIRKAQWVGHVGAPDRRVMLPNRMPIWIELKAPGKKPEPHQLREHNRMRKLGELVEVIDSYEAVDNLIA